LVAAWRALREEDDYVSIFAATQEEGRIAIGFTLEERDFRFADSIKTRRPSSIYEHAPWYISPNVLQDSTYFGIGE
jgi:hypothetical protein